MAAKAAARRVLTERTEVHAETLKRPMPVVSIMDGFEFLRSTPLFHDLSLEEMKTVYDVCERRRFPSGGTIVEQDRPASELERAAFRERLLDRSAYFWLAARARLGPAYVWAVLGLVACGWTWGLARSRRDWLDQGTYVLTGLLLNLLLKAWFALEAGRQLAEDRRQGALELLLSTPLTVQDVLRGQLLALKRQFLGPTAVTLLVFFLFLMAAASDEMLLENPEDRSFWVLLWAAGMVMLIAELAALYWVGMWLALSSKNPTRAAASNLGRILVMPWVVLAMGALVISLTWPQHAGDEPLQKFFLSAWLGVGLAVDLGLGAWARTRLLTEFRLAATRRYEAGPGFWKRLLRGP